VKQLVSPSDWPLFFSSSHSLRFVTHCKNRASEAVTLLAVAPLPPLTEGTVFLKRAAFFFSITGEENKTRSSQEKTAAGAPIMEAIMMQLVTKDVRKHLPELYSTEYDQDPVAHVKYFTPWTSWTWFATEFDGEDTFFGLVDGLFEELGYFSLSELQAVRGPGGLRVERDLYFKPTRLSNVRREQQ
jgi:Protein of unknown function (DUF2958)